jgi:hypothetical protein
MIKIKKRLNEQEALRLSLMSIMVRNKRKELETQGHMSYDSEHELDAFVKAMGFTRTEFISSTLSRNWPGFTKELQLLKLIPS